MRQSTRLVANTLATFSRMALTVGIGLATTRLILDALGEVDFGLISALGATGVLLSTVTAAMAGSTQRHLAYEIGKGDPLALSQTFSSALAMFMIGAAALWLVGVALTPAVMHGLTIPDDRMNAAWWVYQTTLIGLVVNIGLTPYQGIIAAHQELVISTLYELVNSIMRLSIVIALFFVPWDRLVSYAMMMVAGHFVLSAVLVAACLRRYPACRPRPSRFAWTTMRELGVYASWSFLGQMSWVLRQQAAVIIINVAFGPAVNAAFAVAIQVGRYCTNLSQAVTRAVRPAITTLEAKGSRQNVHRLTLVTGKYVPILLSLPIVPLMLDLPQVLDLWLDQVPAYTAQLVWLTVLWIMMQTLMRGYTLALEATGKIGWWTRIGLTLTLLSLVLACLLVFVLELGPWAVPASTVALTCIYAPMAALLIGRHIGLPFRRWLTDTIWPVLLVTGPAGAVAIAARLALPTQPWRVLVLIGVYAAAAIPLFWFVALKPWERQQFSRILGAIRKRMPGASDKANGERSTEADPS